MCATPLVERQSRHFTAELTPGAIEIGGRAGFIAHRNKRGRIVGQLAEQRLTFAHRRFGLAARRNIVRKAGCADDETLHVEDG